MLPTWPLLLENTHYAAIYAAEGDVLGICDPSLTAVSVSAGPSPSVLLRREGRAPVVAALPDTYVVVRVAELQRGCLTATNSSTPS